MAIDAGLLLDPHVVQDPYGFYDAVRRTAPVWQAGEAPLFLVTGFAELAEAARRIEDFSSELRGLIYRDDAGLPAILPVDVGPPTLPISDPPIHTLHKQLIFPRFVSKRMALIEADIALYTEACLDRIERLQEFDFMAEVGGAVPIRAISMLLGLGDYNDAALLRAAYDASEMTGGTLTLEGLHAAHSRSDTVRDWLDEQLARRDGSGAGDLLDAIKAAVVDGQLLHGQALITLITLLSAGAESTASLIGNAVRMLAKRPALVARLRAAPDLLPDFIEEAGRLESPFRHHLRSVPRATELAGVAIPAGATLMLMWGAANRDPARFDDPAALIIERRPQHVTFGRGIHLCVGAALARMEARIVLGAMLRRRQFVRLHPDQAPEWANNVMVRRHHRLTMIF